MKISEVMSRFVVTASPRTSIRDVAELMRSNGIGALVIVEGRSPVGIVTDRDIVTRGLSGTAGEKEIPVSKVMSPDPASCFADQDVAEAAALMGDLQIRRVLVLDRAGDLVGMLSVGDIAENASEELAGQALGEICEKR